MQQETAREWFIMTAYSFGSEFNTKRAIVFAYDACNRFLHGAQWAQKNKQIDQMTTKNKSYQ